MIQQNQANLAGVGQDREEPPGSILGHAGKVKKISRCSFTLPQVHIFTERRLHRTSPHPGQTTCFVPVASAGIW